MYLHHFTTVQRHHRASIRVYTRLTALYKLFSSSSSINCCNLNLNFGNNNSSSTCSSGSNLTMW